MLAIRMQRTGRRGHAQFRVIVQDSRFSPKSGRVVAYVGNYDPHSKKAALDSEKIAAYLENGAQPSDGVARLLQKEGVKLPKWVHLDSEKKRSIRYPEKLRRNRPAEDTVSQKPEEVQAEQPAQNQDEQTKETAKEETQQSEEVSTEQNQSPELEVSQAKEEASSEENTSTEPSKEA